MEERVERRGTQVTVTIGGVSCTREYSRAGHAKRAEYQLLLSKQARLNFFRRKRTK